MSSEKGEIDSSSERAELQEIITKKVIPVVSSYQELLLKDPSDLARERDFLLGEMPQRDLERNQRNLNQLKKDAPELGELREERLRALGHNIPPERALKRSQEQAPKEMTLFLTAAQVYWRKRERTLGFAPEPDYRRHVNYESGIALCGSSQEGTLSYGVFYLGGSPHYSRIYEEVEICQDECEILRDFFVEHFQKRSKEGIPALKFKTTSPNK